MPPSRRPAGREPRAGPAVAHVTIV